MSRTTALESEIKTSNWKGVENVGGIHNPGIILGPILAIQVEKRLEKKRQEKERRLGVFKVLMVTRGSVLSQAHVQALNSIDIEFNSDDERDKNVRNAWKAYLDQLNHFPNDGNEEDKKRWNERVNELLVELLTVMSVAVGYDFDRIYINRAAYVPQKYGETDIELDVIRKAFVQVLVGKASIPIRVVQPDTLQLTPSTSQQ